MLKMADEIPVNLRKTNIYDMYTIKYFLFTCCVSCCMYKLLKTVELNTEKNIQLQPKSHIRWLLLNFFVLCPDITHLQSI